MEALIFLSMIFIAFAIVFTIVYYVNVIENCDNSKSNNEVKDYCRNLVEYYNCFKIPGYYWYIKIRYKITIDKEYFKNKENE